MEIVPDRPGRVSELTSQIERLKQENESLSGTIAGLQNTIERLNKERDVFIGNLSALIKVNGNKTVPDLVINMMIEHGMPWEVFWCEKHNMWHVELDSNFPYHMEQNECEWCQKGR